MEKQRSSGFWPKYAWERLENHLKKQFSTQNVQILYHLHPATSYSLHKGTMERIVSDIRWILSPARNGFYANLWFCSSYLNLLFSQKQIIWCRISLPFCNMDASGRKICKIWQRIGSDMSRPVQQSNGMICITYLCRFSTHLFSSFGSKLHLI